MHSKQPVPATSRRGIASGYDVVTAEVILNSSKCLRECALLIDNIMVREGFPKALHMGLNTAVFRKVSACSLLFGH